MLKLIVVLAIAGFVILLAATGILAWLNWSSRLYTPVLTALLVGIVTGFVSIASTLKTAVIKDSFATMIVVYRDAIRAPIVTPRSAAAAQRIDISMLLAQLPPERQVAGNTDEVFNTGLEAALYSMLKMVREMHRGGWAIANIGGASTATIRDVPELRLVEVPQAALLEALRGNRFASLASETDYWRHAPFSLPPGTRLELYHVPSSPQTGAVKRGLRLVKSLFFTITIQIEPFGIDSGVPPDVEIAESERARIGTLMIKVTITAKFEKLTAGNQHTEEYKEWAAWLIRGLHSRLAVQASG